MTKPGTAVSKSINARYPGGQQNDPEAPSREVLIVDRVLFMPFKPLLWLAYHGVFVKCQKDDLLKLQQHTQTPQTLARILPNLESDVK
jgi:hypothetical protein